MKIIKKKKLIIFDADGTLWNSEKDVLLAINHILIENADFEISKEEFQKFDGFSLEEMAKVILPTNKKYLAKEFTKLFSQYYIDQEHFLDTTDLFPNVKDTIEQFRKQGFFMAICSRKAKRALDKMVEHFELFGFNLIVGTEESNFKHKPDPEAINYIIDNLNVSREDTVIVGDSKIDIIAGKNAQIDTIAVTYGYDTEANLSLVNPTYLLDNFSELKKNIEFKYNKAQYSGKKIFRLQE